ncbi:MAG TPA: molybdopterin-synthase adenylyltransferase MoeB [Vicinamibacterales bacterium]|nr:molybdopterin-synthase adenylyltransferase MoeB [Vicinamibacterales bacterium]
MPVRILIPTPLRPYTDHQSSVEVEGRTVSEVLRQLAERHTELGPHLFRDDGRLRSFVNLYVNDEDIRHLAGEGTAVSDSDTVSIVPSVAGGSGLADSVADLPQLTQDDVARYSRHLIMPEVGVEGQRRLKAARVLCVGAGGLGSPASLYLAAAGVGTLGLVDFDVVDTSNLQRQILYGTSDVGRPKLLAARERLSGLNPGIEVVTHEGPLTSANALQILRDYDIVVDGADNFPARYLVNDACVLLGKPNVYGSIFRFDGQASVFATADGPCYRCLYPEPPPPGLVPSCAEGGVLGILPGIIGTIQAAEAIKLIIGAGESLAGRLMLFDVLDMSIRMMKLKRDPDCAVCGQRPTIRQLIDYDQFCGIAPARNAAPSLPPDFVTSVEALADRIRRRERVWILDVREPREFEICRIPGSSLIPLGDLTRRLEEIPRGDGAPDIVVHCKSGVRSAKAVALLRQQGVERVKNLEGGILAWIDRIDPSQSKY